MNYNEQINNLIKERINYILKQHPDTKASYALDILRKYLRTKNKSECDEFHKQLTSFDWARSFALGMLERGIKYKEDELIRKIKAAMAGMEFLGRAESGDNIKSRILSEIGKNAVNIKLANDPKQAALKEIATHYETNKAQFKRRGYSAQFVRDMHAQYPNIQDQKTIANLVAKLNKANELIPN